MMAKYLATSLAIENVVKAPRVISNCLPISTISISLVGLESRSTMLPASRAACVPVFMATPTSAWASAGRIVGAVAAHGHQLAFGLLVANELELVLGSCLGKEIIHPGFGRNRGRGHRIIAGDHDGANAHPAQFGEALADAALDDILEVDDAKQTAVLGNRQRRAAGLGNRIGNRVDFAHRIRIQGRQNASAPPRPA